MASPSDHDDAIRLFTEYLQRLDTGDAEDFEELCAANPRLVDELRTLKRSWDRLYDVLDALGVSGSFAQRVQERYGKADPEVDLGEEEPSGDFTSETFERLGRRKGAYGRYELKGELARGGQGAILRVWDEDLRRHLAMKVVLGQGDVAPSGQTPPIDDRTLGRFLEEAQVTGQLDHPGIVPVPGLS